MGVWSLITDKLGHSSGPPTPKPEKGKTDKTLRPPNKLSKPRTNSSGNLLAIPGSNNTSCKNSATDLNLPRRSSSVPARPVNLPTAAPQEQGEDARRLKTANPETDDSNGGRRGRSRERDGREKKGRLSTFFRSRSSQAVPVEAKNQLRDVLKEELLDTQKVEDFEAVTQKAAGNPMHRYSVGRPFMPSSQSAFLQSVALLLQRLY